MDFRFSEKEQELRQEIRRFLRAELPPGWVGYGQGEEYGSDDGWAGARLMSRKLAERGWLTMGWPKEYGGPGVPFTEYMVYIEEMNYHRVPGIDMGVGGISWVASCLMLFGSDAQKRDHLGRIASANEFWCTGYSEPNAGSDLAALQCRAVLTGDEFVINGQKIWTSGAHRADYCWLAVRTNPEAPKHKGISILLLDMRTPGITIRPLPNMTGHPSFNEVFFDNVRVPSTSLVGERGKGWYYVAVALDYERASLVGIPARCQRNVDDLAQYVRESPLEYRARQRIRNTLAELNIECEICRLLGYRVAWMQSRGLAPTPESAMAKSLAAELGLRVAAAGMEILGLPGQMGMKAPGCLLGGEIANSYLDTIGLSIAGGTSDINRNVLAIRGLGLPR